MNVKYSPTAQIVLITEPYKSLVAFICLSLNEASDIKRLGRFVKLHRKGVSADDPLLISEQGGRMQYRNVYAKIKSVGQKAGMIHCPRHGVSSLHIIIRYVLGGANSELKSPIRLYERKAIVVSNSIKWPLFRHLDCHSLCAVR